MSLGTILVFLFGLVVITIGAEVLLKGASRIASLLKIRPIVIGLTVVSIGTSLPELAVGLTAVGEGAAAIAIGNIAGTNIVNILFILGLSAAIRPLPLRLKSIKIELYAMIFAAVLLLAFSFDGKLDVWDGIVMLVMGVLYLVLVVKTSKPDDAEARQDVSKEGYPGVVAVKPGYRVWGWNLLLLLSGIVATIYGAEKLVDGAVSMARYFGMSDAVIGLTIIAIGTSAPELATTIVATVRNQRDVAIGNLLGSSIINIFIILGVTTVFTPGGVDIADDILWFDLPLAALVAIVCYPVFRSGQSVSRKEGVAFVGLYLAYLAYLLLFRA